MTLLSTDRAVAEQRRATESFYIAQLLRYLPGRLWGFAFQIASSERGERLAVVSANIDFTLIAMLVNGSVCTFVAGTRLDWPMSITVGVPLACLFALTIRYTSRGATALYAVLSRYVPRLASQQFNYTLAPRSTRTMGIVCGLLLTGLGLYTLAWLGLAAAHPGLNGAPMLEMSALYALSSIIGMLSIVTPGGLGVREGSFVALGLGIAPPETLALVAVLMRVWMMGTEALVALGVVGTLRLHKALLSAASERTHGIDQHG